MEMRLAALEGSEACVGTASGMAAVLLLCMALLKSGDHVVCSHSVFGSTHKLLSTEFAKFGVQTTFVSQTDLSEWAKAIQPNTHLLFAETPTNPLTEVCDIAALSQIARKAGLFWRLTTVFAPPLCKPPSPWVPMWWCILAPNTWMVRAGWWQALCVPAKRW
jgi:O-succinylhomoserine sulfhydrylase